jgi:putative pyruvate formate lyase activating enzyme
MKAEDQTPSYLRLSDIDLSRRIRQAREMLSPCRVCPRECGVDRLGGELGFCETGAVAEVSSYNEHHGEEPPLSGFRGSGTIFFAHCNLRCVFCQNYPISHLGHGSPVEPAGLAVMMLELQRRGCHNINFVTPSHVAPQILEALRLAIKGGLKLPLVWNSGGYDSVETLKLFDGIVDIYLPDMKYDDDANAEKYSGAPQGRGDRPVAPTKGYQKVNRAAIREMHRQVGDLVMDEEGIAIRGLIVRHLVLPCGLAGSEGVLRFLAEDISLGTAVSLMAQYFPANRAHEFPELARGLAAKDYRDAAEAMERLGLENGWRQRRF